MTDQLHPQFLKKFIDLIPPQDESTLPDVADSRLLADLIAAFDVAIRIGIVAPFPGYSMDSVERFEKIKALPEEVNQKIAEMFGYLLRCMGEAIWRKLLNPDDLSAEIERIRELVAQEKESRIDDLYANIMKLNLEYGLVEIIPFREPGRAEEQELQILTKKGRAFHKYAHGTEFERVFTRLNQNKSEHHHALISKAREMLVKSGYEILPDSSIYEPGYLLSVDITARKNNQVFCVMVETGTAIASVEMDKKYALLKKYTGGNLFIVGENQDALRETQRVITAISRGAPVQVHLCNLAEGERYLRTQGHPWTLIRIPAR